MIKPLNAYQVVAQLNSIRDNNNQSLTDEQREALIIAANVIETNYKWDKPIKL